MSGRPDAPRPARVLERRVLSEHLVRLRLARPEGWSSTGVPDEWLPLTVPGQFQTRYYTVRAHDDASLVIDVVVHDRGLVTGWAQTDCVGQEPLIGPARGSFGPPDDAAWAVVVGDLTALPAVARILEETRDVPVTAYVEAPAGTADHYPDAPDGVTWLEPPAAGSGLADLVRGLDWPAGPGYFWMAGESAQMRAIRSHLRRDVGLPGDRQDVMGYWSPDRGARAAGGRPGPRRPGPGVDPGPIYARGKAAGKSDEEIWADYDRARDEAEQ